MKSEINENSESSSKKAYKTESLTNVIKALEKLHLRYYENAVKALTNSGPYILAPPFKKFLVAYDDWNDMTIEAKQQHIKSFMYYIPSADDLLEVFTSQTSTYINQDAINNCKSKWRRDISGKCQCH